jgi:hypothetical protein
VDSQEAMAYSALCGVRSMNEVYPLEKVAEAYERMESGGHGSGWCSPTDNATIISALDEEKLFGKLIHQASANRLNEVADE